MSTRPRPRPRPRPRRPATVAAADPTPGSSSETAIPTPPPTASTFLTAEDEDAMFMRNQNRTAQTWRKLKKVDEAQDVVRRIRKSSDEDEQEESERSSPRPHKHKRRTDKDEALPSWTRLSSKEILISSDDDDDIFTGKGVDARTPNGKRSNGKIRLSEKKRQRSRSKSITPPPELDVQTIQKTRDTVREIMGFAPRPVSPTYDADEDEFVDNVELDPELAVIAQEIQRQASQLGRDETPVIEGGGPENVSIKVRWVPHPQNTSRKSEFFEYVLKRHDTFDQVIDEVADFVAVLADHVYLMMDNKRVFPSATPHSLGVWAEAELEACEKFTFDYLQSARRQRSLSIQPIDMRERSLSEFRTPSPLLEESGEETGVELLSEEEQDDKMKLMLRSAKTKDISLTVRPTTTCMAILKAFLKKAGIADQYPGISTSPKKSRGRKGTTNVPALVIDGEKLSPASQIGDADVEDGDLVEVVGL